MKSFIIHGSELYSRCRWNPVAENNSLAVTSNGHSFTLFDTERMSFKTKESFDFDTGNLIMKNDLSNNFPKSMS